MSEKLLETYADAWNAQDIDRIMSLMTEDCVFEPGGGPKRYGIRYQGQAEVRQRFEEVWAEFPDVRFENPLHFASGDHGCSEWTFTATGKDGGAVEIDGCDLFTFVDGRIHSKRSYLKRRR